jgi:hypothetical protein
VSTNKLLDYLYPATEYVYNITCKRIHILAAIVISRFVYRVKLGHEPRTMNHSLHEMVVVVVVVVVVASVARQKEREAKDKRGHRSSSSGQSMAHDDWRVGRNGGTNKQASRRDVS